FLSDEHLDALKFASEAARRLGLRFDITLGSGWPFGGPRIPITQAAGALRVETVPISSGLKSIAIPHISTGEKIEAVFLVPGSPDALLVGKGTQIKNPVFDSGRMPIPEGVSGASAVIFFISSRTGMTVKRPAVGAEGFVLDHYDQNAIETH